THELLARFNDMAEIHEFFAPDMPLFGNDFFEPSDLKKYKADIEKAYAFLNDELSKTVFINTIKYKISGKINYLRDMETERDEIFHNLINLNSQETFLDLGAYDGDTVQEFQERTKNTYKEIIAVEPDIKNFKKLSLKALVASLLNICVYNFECTLNFSTEGNRNSSFKDGGKNSVAVSTIDSICGDKAVSFIKMDVEGSEKEAIEGGAKTLKTQKPKMIVSAYHKTFDFFTLINQIKEINPDYKIFLRHQPYVPNWETNIIAI
ncbi:MAG: FkbM family methyltransferase, partial [Oscillospiraceae bacterium]